MFSLFVIVLVLKFMFSLLGMQVPNAPLVPAVLQTPLLQNLPAPSSCVMISNMFDPTK